MTAYGQTSAHPPNSSLAIEIYRIVSSKALEGESGGASVGERRQIIDIEKTQDTENKGGCC